MLQIAAPPQAVRWSYCMLLQEIEGTSEEVRRLLYSEQLQRELPRSSDKARALERRAAGAAGAHPGDHPAAAGASRGQAGSWLTASGPLLCRHTCIASELF